MVSNNLNKQSSSSKLDKFKNAFNELSFLYGSPKYRRMAIVCHFTWFATSLSYYATAINADNLSANRVVYVAATGGVDITGIVASMILLRFVGRKLSIFLLYALSSLCLLILLAIPRGMPILNFLIYLSLYINIYLKNRRNRLVSNCGYDCTIWYNSCLCCCNTAYS